MHHNNKGGALLTALFIMTLVAIVATAMSIRLQVDIYRTRLLIAHDKLYLASQALMFWSFNELNNKNNKFTTINAEGMVSKYPKKFALIYKEVKLTGGLYDLQAKINLNNLTDKKGIALFLNLLNQIYPKANDQDKLNIIATIKDWLSAYDLSRGNDAYTAYYLAQTPPYYPSHQLIKSTSEFRLLKDIGAQQNELIQPYITALPEVTPININTARKEILKSLGDGLNENQVENLIKARGNKGFRDTKKLNPLLQKLNIPGEQVTIESKYFLSRATAKTEDLNLVVYLLLKREKNEKGKVSVSILLARSGDLEQNSGKIRAIPGLLVHSPYSQNGLSTSP
ncbi:type II secretion system minor pseudopilin GspK [Legionella sp. km772]|uniref:type II secretion system minor pseudopilin GspK n=1 Tax=Legionella sp. km772 TaxID=2498111 RepID=UPI000F8E6B10|nr:type II secretion system minor pseudopilin GspK [Legionella sp. km772]RUR08281.1 general secretion pathway protein GspK [Legionella sp. km772]